MELSGGRHYLDLTDDVDNGVTPQYKSCNCKLNGGGHYIQRITILDFRQKQMAQWLMSNRNYC